jgi:hypothetical protein
MAKPNPFLAVGNIYEVYTKRETVFAEILKVIGIISLEEAQKVRYSMPVLALQEKVIPTTDEPLDTYLATQNIYRLRAVTANADGSYDEVVVWDDVIDRDRTHQMNVTHIFDTYISLDDAATVSVTQVVNDISQFVNTKYGTQVNFLISKRGTRNAAGEEENLSQNDIVQKQLDEALNIIAALNKFQNTGLPAIEKFSQMDLSGKFAAIQTDISSIQSDVSTISAAIR